MRVLGLARQSSQDRRAGTIETQVELITDGCDELGHVLVHIVEDRVSGKFGALDDLRRKSAGWLTDPVLMSKYDAVMVSVRDRIDRDVEARLQFIRWAEKYGKRVFLADGTEVHARTADAWHAEVSAAEGAELYRRQISEKRAAAARKQKRKGIIPQGGVAIRYGWKRGEDGRPVPVPEEMAVRLKICELAADGITLTDIRDRLKEQGILSRRGKHFDVTMLSRMIGQLGVPYAYAANGVPFYYPDEVPDDVAAHAKEKVAARSFSKNKAKVDSARRDSALLLNVAFCQAGHKMYAQRQDERRQYYRCECGGWSPRMDVLDGIAGEFVKGRLGHLSYMERVFVAATGGGKELAQVIQQMDDIEARLATGFPAAPAERILAKLQARRDELEAIKVTEAHYELRKTGESVKQAWDTGDLRRRRKLLVDDLQVKLTVWREAGKLRVRGECSAMYPAEWLYQER